MIIILRLLFFLDREQLASIRHELKRNFFVWKIFGLVDFSLTPQWIDSKAIWDEEFSLSWDSCDYPFLLSDILLRQLLTLLFLSFKILFCLVFLSNFFSFSFSLIKPSSYLVSSNLHSLSNLSLVYGDEKSECGEVE